MLTAAGTAAIETIRKGDKVWSWNEETGQAELKQVIETYINKTEELVHIGIAGEEIVCTPGHPFYSPVKGWTKAVELRAGDVLATIHGEYVVVACIQHELLEEPIKVYNLQIKDNHTYFVERESVLVHNSCGRNGKQAKLREMADDDKLSSALRGEIKRDINEIKRSKRTSIRVPSGYQMSHDIGHSARLGYSYKFSKLQTIMQHRMHHHIFGYKY